MHGFGLDSRCAHRSGTFTINALTAFAWSVRLNLIQILQVLVVLLITQAISYKYTHGTFTSSVEKFSNSFCNATLAQQCNVSAPLSVQLEVGCAACRFVSVPWLVAHALLHCTAVVGRRAVVQSRECLCSTPLRHRKFVLFYVDGLAHDLAERFGLLPLLRDHSNTYL